MLPNYYFFNHFCTSSEW